MGRFRENEARQMGAYKVFGFVFETLHGRRLCVSVRNGARQQQALCPEVKKGQHRNHCLPNDTSSCCRQICLKAKGLKERCDDLFLWRRNKTSFGFNGILSYDLRCLSLILWRLYKMFLPNLHGDLWIKTARLNRLCVHRMTCVRSGARRKLPLTHRQLKRPRNLIHF